MMICYILKIRKALLLFIAIIAGNDAFAQNLMVNGDFIQTTTGWTATCPTCTVEATNFASTYGGTSTTQHVAEIDDQSTFYQDVCILPGMNYIFSMVASRRTGNGTPPNPEVSNVTIEGLDASSNVVATYVNLNYSRTNNTWAFTPVTGIPVITVPAGSGVARLRVAFSDSTPGAYSTLGMIIDSINLVFQTPPVITGSNATVVGADSTCINSPQDFSVLNLPSTGISYAWNFGAGATPATSTASNPTASWNSTGNKTFNCILGNGTCTVDTISFNVYVRPAAFYSYNDTTCQNVPYIFGGASLTTSGTYVDSFATAGGCDSIVTLNLLVHPQPTVTATNNSPMCINGTNVLNLSVNTSPGATYSWTGPNGFTSAQQNPQISNLTPAASGTYYVTVTLPTGCTATGTTVVVISPGAPLPIVYDMTYCQYDVSVPLNAIGNNLLWYNTPTGGVGDTVVPVPSTQNVGTSTWYVTQTAPNGCISFRAPINVTVNFKAKFNIMADSAVCLYDSTSFTYNGTTPPGGASYTWSTPRTTIITGTTNTASVNVRFDSIGNHEILLAVADDSAGLCESVDSQNIYVAPPPVANFTMPTDGCAGQTINVVVTNGTPDITYNGYTWNFNDADVTSGTVPGPGPYTATYAYYPNGNNNHNISLVAVSRYGCVSDTTTDTINIHPSPTAFIDSISSLSVCTGDTVSMQAAYYDPQNNYEWTPRSAFIKIGQTDTAYKAYAIIASSTDIYLTVTSPYGCKDSSDIPIAGQSCCGVYFPTAFTPCPCNTSGQYMQPVKDRIFHPLTVGHHKIEAFRIVNRWGQTVYASADENAGWDGTLNGVPQEIGDYFWYIKYQCSNGNITEEKGTVTLIR